MNKKIKNSESTSQIKKSNLKWTKEMDMAFIDAMLEQQVNGNKIDGAFTTLAYNNMIQALIEKFGFSIDKNHLKNRIKTIKENFTACFDLFSGLSGFGWNPMTELFEAEPEVWEDLIKAKPKAAKWRYTKIHSYGKLYDLFSKDRANGKGAASAKERLHQWIGEEGSVGPNSMDLETNNEPSSPTSVSNSVVQPSKGSKRKAQMEYLFEKQIEVLDNAISDVAEVMRQGNVIAEKVAQIAEKGLAIAEKGRPHCYSEAEVFNELVDLDVPESVQLDAFLFLNKDQKRVRAFFGVPRQLRKDLFFKMMHESDGI